MEQAKGYSMDKKKDVDISQLLFGKTPPNATDIEKAVLGTILLNPKCLSIVKEVINENDFYLLKHQIICRAIFEISEKSIADFMLVAQWVNDKGLAEDIGGIFEISKLTDRVTNDINVKQYCLVIKQKSAQRRLIDLGSHILNLASDHNEDIFDTLIVAENKLKGINNELQGLNNISLATIGMNVITNFDDRVYKAKNNIVDEKSIYTGIKEWDEINGSLFPGLYVIAGRPGMGKGVHMTELICRMGKKYEIGVINGEMTDEQLLKRIGCNLLNIDNFLFKKKPENVTEQEQDLLKQAMEEAINLKLHIENSKHIHKIANKIRLWVESYGVKCILADFLTMFKVPPELKKYFTKTQEVDYILDIFVDLCKELNIPIILYAQMNREILGRHGVKEPNLADLKQSGSIEELAYQVCFLHRPEYYDEKSDVDEFGESTKGLMYQIIAKHRDGKSNHKMKLKSELQYSKLNDWEEAKLIQFDKNKDTPF